MSIESCIVFVLIFQWAVLASGQTAEDLAAKYPVVSAFKVRPGVLMTAHYSEHG